MSRKPQETGHSVNSNDVLIVYNNQKQMFLPNGGTIISCSPLKGLQTLFFDIHSSEIPDLWDLEFRKLAKGRYLRALICRNGGCDYTLNGKTYNLTAGQAMFDYSTVDNGDYSFSGEYFRGVEITIQSTLINDSKTFRLLRQFIKSMYLPERDIQKSNGYTFAYSSDTERILDTYLNDAFDGLNNIINKSYTVIIGIRLGKDLKNISKKIVDKQTLVANDIYECINNDISKIWTAHFFAVKHGVSDSTVKTYFKNVYGYGFKEFQTKIKMEHAAEQLITTDISITELSQNVGFCDYSVFIRAFKRYYGVSPSKYRSNEKSKFVQHEILDNN